MLKRLKKRTQLFFFLSPESNFRLVPLLKTQLKLIARPTKSQNQILLITLIMNLNPNTLIITLYVNGLNGTVKKLRL